MFHDIKENLDGTANVTTPIFPLTVISLWSWLTTFPHECPGGGEGGTSARTLVKSVSEKKSLLFFYQRNILCSVIVTQFALTAGQVRRRDVRGEAALVDPVPEGAAQVRAQLHAAGREVLLQARQEGPSMHRR